MISAATQDLITKLKAIAGNPFGTAPKRVGLTVGGKNADPLMVKMARPGAWVMFVGDQNVDTSSRVVCGPIVQLNFIVKIIMDYTTETEIIATQYALLGTVRDAIHASDGPKGAPWKYEGQQLEELTDRMIYEQRYSLTLTV